MLGDWALSGRMQLSPRHLRLGLSKRPAPKESGQGLCRHGIEDSTILDVEIKVRSGGFQRQAIPSYLEQSVVSRAVGQESRAFGRHHVSIVLIRPTGTTSIRHAPRQRPMWTMAQWNGQGMR
jgi:hypothetical protein